ncbi:two-component system, OmpR family, phosphate regulon sensor histidine kinase PhoR [Formosa sp. Hel1_31_208]|uniref:sensor histidine kinase n=1 Tax=Formosa sp. Hel1_31_208 TaxID=1798225 RepID=UPI00087A74BD|nr:HAMP domain-containing sensor histidine kinase [Formosa sp. Hel1_31_208]SDR66505.1 two-component system, OmpR family, phosphate regulon sensor histidine kinase PhoR [Formosa sp. Hel1_31_208]
MNDSKYKYILYVIVIVILSTIGIQAFWNYKNYQTNKQQLTKDVQTSLDKAVDDYYTALAQNTTLGLKLEGNAQKNVFDDGGFLDELSLSIDESNKRFNHLDSLKIGDLKGVTVLRGLQIDSVEKLEKSENKSISPKEFKQKLKEIKANYETDSFKVDISGIEMLTSKIFISINNDTLDLKKIDSLFKSDLTRKNINLEYRLDFNDSIAEDHNNINLLEYKNSDKNHKLVLSNTAKSTLLPKNSELNIYYENETWVVLKRIVWTIIISTLLVLAVISCLFYLLKIIKHQKQLAEVKNDLISNITHEFKTPIATIGVALESIQNFNALNDKAKTNNYLDMSTLQLSKLNTMVEKLLETATLDSENLELNIDTYNISEVITAIIDKHKIQNDLKSIQSNIPSDIIAKVDVFHFENAVNNIIDNAFKYGGDDIIVDLKQSESKIELTISDNGHSLSKTNKERIFEKFYRVPKGNTHDIKGFGIGLYYAKKIIDKHHGSLTLDLKNKRTTFKISLPNV